MKKTLLLSLLLTCGVLPAQEKPAIEAFLEVTRFEESSIDNAMAAFDGMMAQLQQAGVPEAAMRDIRAEARLLFMRIFASKEMRKLTGEIYAKHFTEDEILELTEFYRTPLGQKTLLTMPALMSDVMKIAMPEIEKQMPAFQAKVGEIIEKHGEPTAEEGEEESE